jgi:hypothetical protein
VIEQVTEVDWSAYPGPTYYRPSDVPASLRALAAATDEATARDAYHRVLYAIGNDHAGSLYTAAVPALPFVVEIARHGARWARWGALEVLVDAHAFSPDLGCDQVMYAERMMPLAEAVAQIIAPWLPTFRSWLDDPQCPVETRTSIEQLLFDFEE